MSKRPHPSPGEDEDDEVYEPLPKRLAAAAPFGMTEGQWFIKVPGIPGEDKPYPAAGGLMRDSKTGKPEDEKDIPYMAKYRDDKHARLTTWMNTPDISFAKLCAGFANGPLETFLEKDGYMDAVRRADDDRADARRQRGEAIKAGVEPKRVAYTVAEQMYNVATLEKERARTDLGDPLRVVRGTTNVLDWALISWRTAGAAAGVGLLFPYYWRWQYQTVRDMLYRVVTLDDDNAPVLTEEYNAILSIVDYDRRVLFPKMFTLTGDFMTMVKSKLEKPLSKVNGDVEKAGPRFWRVAVVEYILGRDVVHRGDGSDYSPYAHDGSPLSNNFLGDWLARVILTYSIKAVDGLATLANLPKSYRDQLLVEERRDLASPDPLFYRLRPAGSDILTLVGLPGGIFFQRENPRVDQQTQVKNELAAIFTFAGILGPGGGLQPTSDILAILDRTLFYNGPGPLGLVNWHPAYPTLANYTWACDFLDRVLSPQLVQIARVLMPVDELRIERLFSFGFNLTPSSLRGRGQKNREELQWDAATIEAMTLSESLDAIHYNLSVIGLTAVAPSTRFIKGGGNPPAADALNDFFAPGNTIHRFAPSDWEAVFAGTYFNTKGVPANPGEHRYGIVVNVALPLAAHLFATKMKQWLGTFGRSLHVRLPTDTAASSFTYPFPVVTATREVADVQDRIQTLVREAASAAANTRSTTNQDLKDKLDKIVQDVANPTEKLISRDAETQSQVGRSMAAEFLARAWVEGEDYLKDPRRLPLLVEGGAGTPPATLRDRIDAWQGAARASPWARIAYFVDFLDFLYGSTEYWDRKVIKAKQTMDTAHHLLQQAVTMAPDQRSLEDTIRENYIRTADEMLQPIISGYTYFTDSFKATIALALYNVHEGIDSTVRLEDLTSAAPENNAIRTAFASYIGTLMAYKQLEHPKTYQKDKQFPFILAREQAGLRMLRRALADGRGRGRRAPDPGFHFTIL